MDKKLTQKEASGMTMNERLFHAGLLIDFDKARNERDETVLRSILKRVFIPSHQIEDYIRNLYDE